mgnify:CR=1 FL=1|jgi:hypothetical protein
MKKLVQSLIFDSALWTAYHGHVNYTRLLTLWCRKVYHPCSLRDIESTINSKNEDFDFFANFDHKCKTF